MTTSSSLVTKSLTTKEIECPCCGGVVYNIEFVNLLEVVRQSVGLPFFYSKGGFYRCRMFNDTLNNSSKRSQHLLGNACDITTHNFTAADKWNLVRHAIQVGLSVGVYSAHIHLDRRKGVPVLFYGSY